MPVVYDAQPLVPEERLPSVAVGEALNSFRDRGDSRLAGALENIQDAFNALSAALNDAADGRFDQLFVTDSQTGEVIGRIGSFEQLSGAAFIRLWVGGNVNDPENTAPLYVDNNGQVQIVLGDTDNAAALTVLDGSGQLVLWAGENDGDYGLWAGNIWIGGTGPDDATFWSDGSSTFIGNGYITVLDDSPTPNSVAWIGIQDFGGDTYYGAGFESLYVGPGADPTTAPLFADENGVVIGQNGHISVMDDSPTPVEVGWFGVRTFSGTPYYGGHVREWRIGGDIADPTTANIIATSGGVSIRDTPFSLDLDGTLTEIKNQAVPGFGGVGHVAGLYMTTPLDGLQSVVTSRGFEGGQAGTKFFSLQSDTGGAGGLFSLADPSGSTTISAVGATGNMQANIFNAMGGFAAGGVSGISVVQGMVSSVSPITTTLNYLNHGGVPTSTLVVVGLSVTNASRTFAGGILTA
jgi:hypothetical protein